MPRRIAVVGGGLSGLATAFYLQRDCPAAIITVYEAAERLGGVIGTLRIDAANGCFVIDQGADMFATEPPAAIQLCRDLGVEGQLIIPDPAKAGAMVVHRGQLVKIPDGFVLMRATKLWQMMTTPLLSLSGKLRFLGERFVRPAPGLMLDSEDQSVADFVRQRMGQEVLDRLVGPLVAGIYTADVEQLSMKATMAPMVEMVNRHGSLAQATLARRRDNQDSAERNSAGARYSKFRGFPNGMQQLIDALANALDPHSIRTGVAVRKLLYASLAATPWRIETAEGISDFDEVVLATPAAAAARLLRNIDHQAANDHAQISTACQAAAQSLQSIESASTAIAVLCVPQSQISRLPKQFGIVVPPIERRSILAVSFASHKYASRCPADHTIIRVFVGGALQAPLLHQSDEKILAMVRQELAQLIGFSGRESAAVVVRWNDAMPQYHVGHLDKVRSIENALQSIPHLHLVCNALRGVGIAPLVAMAKQTADRISAADQAAVSKPADEAPADSA